MNRSLDPVTRVFIFYATSTPTNNFEWVKLPTLAPCSEVILDEDVWRDHKNDQGSALTPQDLVGADSQPFAGMTFSDRDGIGWRRDLNGLEQFEMKPLSLQGSMGLAISYHGEGVHLKKALSCGATA